MATDEGEVLRIVRAASEGRLTANEHDRYVIDGEERPARRARESAQRRGLIEVASYVPVPRWRPTRKGYALLAEARDAH